MPRLPRDDTVDSWHHVMNRGIAKRPIFENNRDARFFLSLLAKEHRRGALEIHGFSLMLNHFHLLVRSPRGQLSQAMQRIQTKYSRWFNRSRKRDGPLVRGRFKSSRIHDLAYRRNVLRYIRDNAVSAHIAARPEDHAWSSAALRSRGAAPRWLSQSWVDQEIRARGATSLSEAFPSRLDSATRRWVEEQLGSRVPDELEEATMVHVAGARTVAWAIRKTKLADGTKPFRPVSPTRLVARVIREFVRRTGPLLGLVRRSRRDAWFFMKAGVFRALSGCRLREIGFWLRRHESTVCRALRVHRALLKRSPEYEALQAQIASTVLAKLRPA